MKFLFVFCSRAIKTNQDLLPETPWIHIFYNDFWGTLLTHSGSHKSYRPLCTLSFRINHAVGGMDPWGYHLVNVLLHAAVTGLFTNFSRILFGDGYWTLIAGLLFASHPIHTEVVAGIVGRGRYWSLPLLSAFPHVLREALLYQRFLTKYLGLDLGSRAVCRMQHAVEGARSDCSGHFSCVRYLCISSTENASDHFCFIQGESSLL